ncbi:MAG: agmatinase [Gammaproteobacteria bacterium]|nr:agmatinase [Gammaproteobacteria bacterium]
MGSDRDSTYSGPLSFLRRKYTRNIENADVVVTGVPFDCATTNRPGTRLGPRAIREASVQLTDLPTFPYGFDLFEHLAIVDYGDCYIDHGYPGAVTELVEAHADKILDSQAKMLTLGGDHFVTYPLLRAHAKKYGPLSLLHFDAHLDTWWDDGKRIDHGSMFARAAEEGLVVPSQSVQVGIRSFNDKSYGFNVLNAPFVHEEGIKTTLCEIKRILGNNKVYLTFDIDCLDPSVAPGTGTPVAGGLSMAQALSIMRSLGDLDLLAMDVMEVAPAYDVSEITALAGATLAHEFLSLLAIKNGAKPVTPTP